jgi:hypothetical protein
LALRRLTPRALLDVLGDRPEPPSWLRDLACRREKPYGMPTAFLQTRGPADDITPAAAPRTVADSLRRTAGVIDMTAP